MPIALLSGGEQVHLPTHQHSTLDLQIKQFGLACTIRETIYSPDERIPPLVGEVLWVADYLNFLGR